MALDTEVKLSPGRWKGEMLQRIQEEQMITPGELADEVGVHLVTISRIWTGAHNPSIPLLEKIVKALTANLTGLRECSPRA